MNWQLEPPGRRQPTLLFHCLESLGNGTELAQPVTLLDEADFPTDVVNIVIEGWFEPQPSQSFLFGIKIQPLLNLITKCMLLLNRLFKSNIHSHINVLVTGSYAAQRLVAGCFSCCPSSPPASAGAFSTLVASSQVVAATAFRERLIPAGLKPGSARKRPRQRSIVGKIGVPGSRKTRR